MSAALHDERFSMTALFFLGILILGAGLFLDVAAAVVFGFGVLILAMYFAGWRIPKIEKDLQNARRRLAISLERLGQGSRSFYCP